MTFTISIIVRVIETYNKIMSGQKSDPKHCVGTWMIWLVPGCSGKLNSPRFCVLKAAIKFQMWGTSFEGAGKHADDPASDITLP